jgi:Ca2+-binding EF-hand superfamily protein
MRKLFSLLTVVAVVFGEVAVSQAADKADKPKRDPEAQFKMRDKDGDGNLNEAEFLGKLEGDKATKAKELFAKLDKDKDSKVTLEEFKARGKKAK